MGKEIDFHNIEIKGVWSADENADNNLLSTKLQTEYGKQKLGS